MSAPVMMTAKEHTDALCTMARASARRTRDGYPGVTPKAGWAAWAGDNAEHLAKADRARVREAYIGGMRKVAT